MSPPPVVVEQMAEELELSEDGLEAVQVTLEFTIATCGCSKPRFCNPMPRWSAGMPAMKPRPGSE
jgi:hypothetical protein